MFVTRLDTGDIDLLPFNGNVICLEYRLDRLGYLCSNAISWYQSSGIFASEFGRFKDVGRDRSFGLYAGIVCMVPVSFKSRKDLVKGFNTLRLIGTAPALKRGWFMTFAEYWAVVQDQRSAPRDCNTFLLFTRQQLT